MPNIRRGMPDVSLTKDEFKRRFRQRFYDPAFAPLQEEIEHLADVAWDGYDNYRKALRTEPAGPGFADPDYELSIEWRAASQKVQDAEQRQKDLSSPPRILLINGATRSEHTCSGETSKTWRLAMIAYETFAREKDFEMEVLDLSRLASEYGRTIHPCKTCVSTAMPLCHWPCSCYPNHAMGQVGDWMNDIYPMWVAAHGIMIICPVTGIRHRRRLSS
jgi:NADPH-dependent FMN reductase